MAIETLGFTTREAREEQYKAWKLEDSKGLGRHTTHVDNKPQIIYVVTRYVPAAVEPEGTETKVLLPETTESEKMVSEGGNTNETVEIQPEAVQPEVGSAA